MRRFVVDVNVSFDCNDVNTRTFLTVNDVNTRTFPTVTDVRGIAAYRLARLHRQSLRTLFVCFFDLRTLF